MKKKYLAFGLIGLTLLSNQFKNGYNVTLNNDFKTETNKVYENGTAIYFNPETGLKCTESEAVSTTGTKTGCMKWYAFNDSVDSSTLNMILDHNTTATVAWNSSGDNTGGMNEVATSLSSDTSTWNSSLNARLITADEVAQITGNTTFNTSPAWFYFDSNSQTKTATSQGTSQYSWLYDYTNDCTSNGCNINDSSNYGYWTSTPISNATASAWNVSYSGRLNTFMVSISYELGVRPVVTINKSQLFEAVSKEDTENKITINAEDTSIISSSTELKVESIATDSETYTEIKKYITNIENIKVYDINLYENGSIVQPNGKVTLTFEVGNMDINKVKVYRMNDDKTYTKIDSKIVDNKIQIEVNHFSIYILTEEEINTDVIIDNNTNDNTNENEDEDITENPNTGERIFYVVDVMIIMIFSIAIIYIKLNDKNKYINVFQKK